MRERFQSLGNGKAWDAYKQSAVGTRVEWAGYVNDVEDPARGSTVEVDMELIAGPAAYNVILAVSRYVGVGLSEKQHIRFEGRIDRIWDSMDGGILSPLISLEDVKIHE